METANSSALRPAHAFTVSPFHLVVANMFSGLSLEDSRCLLFAVAFSQGVLPTVHSLVSGLRGRGSKLCTVAFRPPLTCNHLLAKDYLFEAHPSLGSL